MDLNEFPPKYDYDFLDGTYEETFEIKFLYLHNKMTYISS